MLTARCFVCARLRATMWRRETRYGSGYMTKVAKKQRRKRDGAFRLPFALSRRARAPSQDRASTGAVPGRLFDSRLGAHPPARSPLLRGALGSLACRLAFAFSLHTSHAWHGNTRLAGWHPPPRDAPCSLESRGLRAVPASPTAHRPPITHSCQQISIASAFTLPVQLPFPITPVQPTLLATLLLP